MKNHASKSRSNTLPLKSRVIFGAMVGLFALVGAVLVIGSRAAGPTAQFEAESGPRTSPATTVSDTAASAGQSLKFNAPTTGACTLFPADNIWNRRIDTMSVDANSTAYINTIGANTGFHADFGSGLWNGGPIGIPYVTVGASQAKVPVTFDVADESDPGPYPIPPNAPIEGGPNSTGDRHVLVWDTANCKLYEIYDSHPQANGSWQTYSGATWDLRSHALRPDTWTSGDAAGLPILPGLVRYDEVLAGEIKHAIRFTAPQTRKAHIWPARHNASSLTGTQYPPMGQRFRLKASFNISTYPRDLQVILLAMQRYGIILADNGSSWYVSGAPDERWDNDILSQISTIKGNMFEAIDESSLRISPDSGQAR